jgi:hypothetical protein
VGDQDGRGGQRPQAVEGGIETLAPVRAGGGHARMEYLIGGQTGCSV